MHFLSSISRPWNRKRAYKTLNSWKKPGLFAGLGILATEGRRAFTELSLKKELRLEI